MDMWRGRFSKGSRSFLPRVWWPSTWKSVNLRGKKCFMSPGEASSHHHHAAALFYTKAKALDKTFFTCT